MTMEVFLSSEQLHQAHRRIKAGYFVFSAFMAYFLGCVFGRVLWDHSRTNTTMV